MFIVLAICGIWSLFTINLSVTQAFNSSKYERENVDYEKIKEDTGLDIEALSTDNSFVKTYDTDEGFTVVLGKYFIDLNESYLGRAFTKVMQGITLGVNNLKNFIGEIVY